MKQNKKKKKQIVSDDVVKAIHKGGRELQREMNGGLQFVNTHKVFKNKKKYNRKDEKIKQSKEFDCFIYIFKFLMMNNLKNS